MKMLCVPTILGGRWYSYEKESSSYPSDNALHLHRKREERIFPPRKSIKKNQIIRNNEVNASWVHRRYADTHTNAWDQLYEGDETMK